MNKDLILQGRLVTDADIRLIKELMNSHPSWLRTRLSKELCKIWDWRSHSGQLKDMACRSYLRKLESHGFITLPKARSNPNNASRCRPIEPVFHSQDKIECNLKELYPITLSLVERGYELQLFKYLISAYHYLGWSGTVGENLKYLIYDKFDRPLGCLMFGAAAWKVGPRDKYIDWSIKEREANLSYICNNNRFLLLDWVKVKHLASHILGRVCRRISFDWENKYNHPVYLLETFVEKNRFLGTCYKASNWSFVGDTQGRGKLDGKNEYALPVKTIWLYPLMKDFRERLKNA